jgi:hypothetical protein
MEDDEAGRLAAFRSRFGEDYEAKAEDDAMTASDANQKVSLTKQMADPDWLTIIKQKSDETETKVELKEEDGWGGLMDMIATASAQSSGSLTKKKKDGAVTESKPTTTKKK